MAMIKTIIITIKTRIRTIRMDSITIIIKITIVVGTKVKIVSITIITTTTMEIILGTIAIQV
jgi:hypothetical protein